MTKDLDSLKVTFTEDEKLLDASNYSLWAYKVEQVLRKKKLWRIVCGILISIIPMKTATSTTTGATPPAVATAPDTETAAVDITGADSTANEAPPASVTTSATSAAPASSGVAISTSSPTVLYLTQEEYDEKIDDIAVIFMNTCHTSILPDLQMYRNEPSVLWVVLKDRYETSSLQRKVELKTSLYTIKYTEGEPMDDFIKRISKIVMDLGRIQERLTDSELIEAALRGLPISWNSWLSSYSLIVADRKDIKYSSLVQALLTEYRRRKQMTDNEVQSSMLAAAPAPRINTVPNLTLPRMQQNTGWRGRGGRRGRGAGGGRYNAAGRPVPTCNYCNKRGHQEQQCFIKLAATDLQSLTTNQIREVQEHIRVTREANNAREANRAEAVHPPDAAETNAEGEPSAMTMEALLSEIDIPSQLPSPWILDSGASTHISKEKGQFTSLKNDGSVSHVLTANGTKMPTS